MAQKNKSRNPRLLQSRGSSRYSIQAQGLTFPLFFIKWFLNRIEEGFVLSKNPYNNPIYKYNFNPKTIDVMCFCSKNPKPLVKNLDKLSDYRQFWFATINPYGKDIEVNVPDYRRVMKTLKELSRL